MMFFFALMLGVISVLVPPALECFVLALTFACWNQYGLSVVPSVNLISNLGFSKESTHTKKPSPLANMFTERIELPLKHPQLISRHQKADRYVERQQFSRPILYRLLQKFFRSIYLRKK